MSRRRGGYRLFRPRYDWKMIRDQVGESAYGNGYLEIEVKNPRTHIEKEKALYTDYEIEMKTNNPAFPLFHSRVRRRYSEFVWLRNKLGLEDIIMVNAPKLPRKQVIGRFKDSFLQRRQAGLQKFLNRLASITVFANNPVLLIFLQTSLSNKQMDYYLKTRTPGGIRSLILRLHEKKLKAEENHLRRPRRRTISAEYPPTEKSESQKSKSYGKGWSSYYGDNLFGYDSDKANVDIPEYRDMKKVRSISCVAYPSGLLTLPTIPGSSEDGLDSIESASNTEPELHEEHPLSHSWHGTVRDEIDFVLEEYEIIPLDSIAQVGTDNNDNEEFFDMDSDYVDVNSELRRGNEHRFDY